MRPFVFAPALAVATSCAAAPHGPPPGHHGHHGHHGHQGHHEGFGDARRWSEVFDDPARDAWQRPDEVIAALELGPDARVADVGAGTGYFSVRLAPRVPRGRVWAVDLEPSLLAHVRERAASMRLENLFPVLGTPTSPMLPEAVDVVLVVDTWHHVEDRVAYARGLAPMLRPGGRLVIVDFTLDAPEGPPREMRLAPERVHDELTAAGWERVAEVRTLPRQYVVTYRPAAQAR